MSKLVKRFWSALGYGEDEEQNQRGGGGHQASSERDDSRIQRDEMADQDQADGAASKSRDPKEQHIQEGYSGKIQNSWDGLTSNHHHQQVVAGNIDKGALTGQASGLVSQVTQNSSQRKTNNNQRQCQKRIDNCGEDGSGNAVPRGLQRMNISDSKSQPSHLISASGAGSSKQTKKQTVQQNMMGGQRSSRFHQANGGGRSKVKFESDIHPILSNSNRQMASQNHQHSQRQQQLSRNKQIILGNEGNIQIDLHKMKQVSSDKSKVIQPKSQRNPLKPKAQQKKSIADIEETLALSKSRAVSDDEDQQIQEEANTPADSNMDEDKNCGRASDSQQSDDDDGGRNDSALEEDEESCDEDMDNQEGNDEERGGGGGTSADEQNEQDELANDIEFMKQSKNKLKRQRTTNDNEQHLFPKQSSLFKTNSKMSSSLWKKKDGGSGNGSGIEIIEGEEEQQAQIDEADMFIKELKDEFDDIEDQLFNQDEQHSSQNEGESGSDMEEQDEENSSEAVATKQQNGSSQQQSNLQKKLTSKMQRKMDQINEKKLKQLKKLQFQRQKAETVAQIDRFRKRLGLPKQSLLTCEGQVVSQQTVHSQQSNTNKTLQTEQQMMASQQILSGGGTQIVNNATPNGGDNQLLNYKNSLRQSLRQLHSTFLKQQQKSATSVSANINQKVFNPGATSGNPSLTCPICMDTIISCRIAVCGHSFCHQCIAECLIRKKECPVCRTVIRRKVLQESLIVDSAVKMISAQQNQDEFKRWQDRILKYHQWIQSHRIISVKAGDKIDVCDTENIWCKATVELVIKSQNRKDLVYLHYEGWNRKYDEFIYIDSHRVAPLGLYTNRNDIPVYSMLNNNGRNGPVMYAVVLQSAQDPRLADYERRINAMNNHEAADDDDDDMDDAQDDIPDEPIMPNFVARNQSLPARNIDSRDDAIAAEQNRLIANAQQQSASNSNTTAANENNNHVELQSQLSEIQPIPMNQLRNRQSETQQSAVGQQQEFGVAATNNTASNTVVTQQRSQQETQTSTVAQQTERQAPSTIPAEPLGSSLIDNDLPSSNQQQMERAVTTQQPQNQHQPSVQQPTNTQQTTPTPSASPPCEHPQNWKEQFAAMKKLQQKGLLNPQGEIFKQLSTAGEVTTPNPSTPQLPPLAETTTSTTPAPVPNTVQTSSQQINSNEQETASVRMQGAGAVSAQQSQQTVQRQEAEQGRDQQSQSREERANNSNNNNNNSNVNITNASSNDAIQQQQAMQNQQQPIQQQQSTTTEQQASSLAGCVNPPAATTIPAETEEEDQTSQKNHQQAGSDAPKENKNNNEKKDEQQ